jgi:hypothetical protein
MRSNRTDVRWGGGEGSVGRPILPLACLAEPLREQLAHGPLYMCMRCVRVCVCVCVCFGGKRGVGGELRVGYWVCVRTGRRRRWEPQ